MLEDVKKSFFQVDNERRLFLGKIFLYLCCYYLGAPGMILLTFLPQMKRTRPCSKPPLWGRR